MIGKIKWPCDAKTKKYFELISSRVEKQFELAKKAREKGFDVSTEVESLPVTDLAERAEKICGPPGIAKRYREVLNENNGDRMQSLFQIFRELIEQKWIQIPDLQKRIELAIKSGLVLMTEGVVVSPLDGLPKVLISKNLDGTKYIDVYFSGPIRAAGGSATVIPLILADYARSLLDIDRYKPTEEEVERYVEEIMIYQTEIISRQYKVPEEEIKTIIRGCPICINGIPTEEREVSVHRNIDRISSNRIRGGMALVVSEGVALKAMKILSWANQLSLDWKWLEKIIKVEKTADKITEITPTDKYLEGLAAGRPLLAYPSAFGGFRLRYGKARNTGCMAKAINPALMYLLDEFIAVGTHIRIERPGKAAQLFPCDSIDGPIIKLKNGEVIQVNSIELAEKLKPQLEQILFLGDILVTLGDFKKTAHPLVPSAYVEEWWIQDLKKAVTSNNFNVEIEKLIANNGRENELNFDFAFKLSKDFGIPLHPKFIYYYKILSKKDLIELINEFKNAEIESLDERIIQVKVSEKIKPLLELIGLEHKIIDGKIVIEEKHAKNVLTCFGFFNEKVLELVSENVLESLSKISGVKIMDKCGTFIGARMGRPEAAKERQMKGNPHILFPIALKGGPTRSINKAMNDIDKKSLQEGVIEVEIALFKCMKCEKILPYYYCKECGIRTMKVNSCNDCMRIVEGERCKGCGSINLSEFNKRKIELKKMLGEAVENLDERMPDLIKGVKGLFAESKIPEPLEKGILRGKHNIHIYRDGTSRFELLNAPLNFFKPKEIGLTVEKVKVLGYTVDFEGKEITSEEQLIELFPQDVIVNEKAGIWMLRMSKFIDELLEKFYKIEPYYKVNSKEELIGELVIGLAPHTSAGIVQRVIGFSKALLMWCHPYSVMCRRRNFDGDQDSIMLLMDSLLNFSQTYLSHKSGGRMDAPLVFTVALNPQEIDDEVYSMETCKEYPIELYEKSLNYETSFLNFISTVQKKLGKENQFTELNFTHSTTLFDAGPKQSMYTQLKEMEEKIKRQAELQFKIKSVKGKDALERVLRSHFFPDIIGNARAFTRQQFRCSKCNSKYRRIPLKGTCTKCNNELILTISQGTVRKYLEIAKQIIYNYDLSTYLKQRIELAELEIDSIFKDDKPSQKSLFEFV